MLKPKVTQPIPTVKTLIQEVRQARKEVQATPGSSGIRAEAINLCDTFELELTPFAPDNPTLYALERELLNVLISGTRPLQKWESFIWKDTEDKGPILVDYYGLDSELSESISRLLQNIKHFRRKRDQQPGSPKNPFAEIQGIMLQERIGICVAPALLATLFKRLGTKDFTMETFLLNFQLGCDTRNTKQTQAIIAERFGLLNGVFATRSQTGVRPEHRSRLEQQALTWLKGEYKRYLRIVWRPHIPVIPTESASQVSVSDSSLALVKLKAQEISVKLKSKQASVIEKKWEEQPLFAALAFNEIFVARQTPHESQDHSYLLTAYETALQETGENSLIIRTLGNIALASCISDQFPPDDLECILTPSEAIPRLIDTLENHEQQIIKLRFAQNGVSFATASETVEQCGLGSIQMLLQQERAIFRKMALNSLGFMNATLSGFNTQEFLETGSLQRSAT